MKAHENLKPLLVARPGFVLYETLVKCEALQAPERNKKSGFLTVAAYYEFPLYPADSVIKSPPTIDAVVKVNFQFPTRYGDSFTVGVEIKETKADMYRTRGQFERYIGHTDFLFLAVRKELIPFALERVKNLPEYGVVDINTGQIFKAPRRQYPSAAEKNRVNETFNIGFTFGRNIAIAKSPAFLGTNLFDFSDEPEDHDARLSFLGKINDLDAERDKRLAALPKSKRMTSFFALSKMVQSDS